MLLAIVLTQCGSGSPVERAREYQAGGRYDAAVEVLRPLIERKSRDPVVLYLYGVNQRLAGRPGLALWSLLQARRFEGWEVGAGLELAVAAQQARAWPTAIEAASAVIEREPDNPYAYALRARARMEARTDNEGALADFDRTIAMHPDDAALRLGRVAILLRLKRIEEAGEVLRSIEAIATAQEFSTGARAEFCVARAIFERESGDTETATAAFEECLERYPEMPHVVIAIVEHYDALGQPTRGNEILAAVLESRPLEFIPRAQLARRLHAMGEADRAEALLLEGGELAHPLAAAYALSTLAELYVQGRRFTDAAKVFGRVRELEGDAGPQRILAHAELLALAGDMESALALADELGEHVYRHLVYAAVSSGERNAQRALEHLEMAIVQWPNNAAAQYYAGRAAERVGDFPRAVDAYRNAIRAGSGETDAGMKLAELHRAAGRLREAHVAVHHHLEGHPMDLEAALLAVELAAQLEPKRLQASLEAVPGDQAWARVAAVLSDVTARRSGAAAAVDLLRRNPRIDLENPRDAAAIEALVRHLRAAKRDAEARSIAERLVAQSPADARLHWILSLSSDGKDARRALDRALALDPTLEAPARQRARFLARASDVDAAVTSLEGFVAQSPEVLLDMAQLLTSAGRADEAEGRLEALLWERPHRADAARELARLRLARGAGREARTLELARRGVRFGGGAEAVEVLARVREARGEVAGDEVLSRRNVQAE